MSLLSAVGGFRQVVVLSIPLFLTAILYWLLNLRSEHTNTASKLLTASGIGLLAAIMGLAINCLISLCGQIRFVKFGSISWIQLASDNLLTAFHDFMSALGFREGAFISLSATLPNLVAIGLLVLVVSSFIGLFRHRERYTAAETILGIFSLSSLVVIIGIGVLFTYQHYSMLELRYYYPAMVMLIPWLAVYWQKGFGDWSITLKRITVKLRVVAQAVVLTSVILVGLLTSYNFYFQSGNHYGNNQSLYAITAALAEAGYYQGYASHWQGNILTEMSDGEIEVWLWGDTFYGNSKYDSLEQRSCWLQKTEHLPTEPAGKVFMLFTQTENKELTIPQQLAATDGHVFYADDFYIVYTYESMVELRAAIAAAE